MGVRGLIGVGVAAFLVSLVLLFPANMATEMVLADTGVRYGKVSGNVWGMTLENAEWRGVSLGRLQIQPRVFSLVTGSPAAAVSFENKKHRGRIAQLEAGRSVRLLDFSVLTEVEGRFGPAVLKGSVSVQGQEISFNSSGRCLTGRAHFRSNILETVFAKIGGVAPVLEGRLVCGADGEMLVTFSGVGDFVTINGTGSWQGGRQLVTDIIVAFKVGVKLPSSIKTVLEFSGLQPTDDGWSGQLSLDIY